MRKVTSKKAFRFIAALICVCMTLSNFTGLAAYGENAPETGNGTTGEISEVIPEEQPGSGTENDSEGETEPNVTVDRFENLTGAEIVNMFSQAAEGIRSLYEGITEEEWETIRSILSDAEMNTVIGLLADAGCIDAPQDADEPENDEPAPEDGEPGIEPVSIDTEKVTLSDALKSYLEAHAGTYVTEKNNYKVGNNTYEGSEWSVVIADNGEDVQLLYNGEDTKAVVTSFGTIGADGKPTNFTFSKESEWFTSNGTTNQTLVFGWNQYGYITMPNATVYKSAADNKEVLYRFSSAVHMYNKTAALEFFKELQDTYTINDGSDWKIEIGKDSITLTDGKDGGDIFLDYVNFGNAAATYGNVTSLVFSSANWYNNTGATPYQTLTFTWSPVVNAGTVGKTNGFERYVFTSPAAYIYEPAKTVSKHFIANNMFMPDALETYSREYFKEYAGTYEISADYGTYYDPEFKDWKLEIDDAGNVTMQYKTDGTKYPAVLTKALNRTCTSPDGATKTDVQYVNQMYVCLPGYYTDVACTTPAYLTLTWYINDTAKNVSEGEGAWRFQISAANLYRAGADGAAELLRSPTIYCDHTEKYIGMAKNFLKNYSGKYYYNYAGTTGEYIQITDEGAVEWHYFNGKDLETRIPVHYNFSNINYLNGDPSIENQWTVSSMYFTDGNWFAASENTATTDRVSITMNFDVAHERFRPNYNNYTVYGAKAGDEPGQPLRTYNAYGPGNSGKDRESYFRFDEVKKFFADFPKEYPLNDNSGWMITIDPTSGQPTLTDGKETANNIKITEVTYTTDATAGYPAVKTGFSSFTFTSSDWYNAAGTQNYQTLSPTWSSVVDKSATSPEHPDGFVRYAFNTNKTLYSAPDGVDETGNPTGAGKILKSLPNNTALFAAEGGYANEYFTDYQGEYALAPGFGANYNEMYKDWKIVIGENGSVTLETGGNKYQATLASANRIQKYDASGNKLENQFVPSVKTMYVYMPGYYSNTDCTTPAYLTLTWNINSRAQAKDHAGEPYKYFTTSGTFYKPDGNGGAEKIVLPTMYFMHTGYVDWYKTYYKNFAGKYYINNPGSATDRRDETGYKDEYIEIKADGTPVYHAFDGKDHEVVFVTMSDADKDKYVQNDSANAIPSAVYFLDSNWYSNNDNGTKSSAPAAYSFTWANDQTANFTQARRFTAPGTAVYAAQKKGEDGSWLAPSETELLHYFTTNVTFTYPGSAEFNAENPADKDKASIAEMKQYLRKFAYIPNEDSSNEYTEYKFNDPNIDWGIRITKDGDVLVDFNDGTGPDEFVKVNPKLVFAYNATNAAVGINGRYLSSLLIEVPDHYSDDAATQPAFITLTWGGGNSANITTHYFTANAATLYHKPGSAANHKVVLSTTERFVCDAELDKDRIYMEQFAGEYYANDGSDWGMKITAEGKVQIKFGTEDYVDVMVAPTITENATYGKYVSSIVVPVEGWYSNAECTTTATLTITPSLITSTTSGGQTGESAHMNNYFTVAAAYVYLKDSDGDGEPEHLTIPALEFGSEADYVNAQQWLAQSNYTGVYKPQMTDKWYAEINEKGEVYFYVEDPAVTGGEHAGYRQIKPRVTLAKALNEATYVTSGVTGFSVMFPNARATQTNNSVQAIEQIQKVTFGAATIAGQAPTLGDETYYIYAGNTMLYDAKNDKGEDWAVVTKSTEPGYNKTFDKLYANDRAYSDENREKARNYFKNYAGTYYLDDPGAPGYIEIDTNGNITWVPEDETLVSEGKMYFADVAFNSDNATLGEDGKHLPKSIYIWYNGYRNGAKDQAEVVNQYSPIQRADVTWSNYNNNATNELTYHSFYGGATLYPDTPEDSEKVTIDGNNHYFKSGSHTGSTTGLLPDGTYETADRQHKIVVETKDGKTSYTFVTPDGGNYPLAVLGEGADRSLRGRIGETTSVFGMFYVSVSHGGLVSGSNAPINYKNKSEGTVTIPVSTPFTNYSQTEEDINGPIVVAKPGQSVSEGTHYASFAKAMGNVENGGTIYLTDDFEIGYMAEIAGDKTITIDGQGHTISRAESYTGSLFKIDAGDDVTFKNVKIDAGAYWDWNNELVDRDIQISTFGVQLPDGRGGNTNNCYAYGGGKPVIYGVRNAESRMLPNETDMQKLIDQHFGGGKRYEYDPSNPEPAAMSLEETGTGTNVVSTANLIQVGGTVTLENTEIGYMSTYDATADKYGGYGVFGITDKGATINLNTGTDIHHLDTTANALVRGMNETTVNFNDDAQVHEVYASSGNGGLIDMRNNSTVTINDNAQLYDVFAYNSNGSIVMDYGGKLEINGGSIHHNAGVGGTSNGHGMTLYIYNNSDFTMNGGEIAYNIGHGTSTVYQQPGSKGMNFQKGSLHDNLRWTQKSVSSGERTDTECDIYVLSDATFGPEMAVDEDIVINERGNAENFGKLKGSVTVLGKQEGEDVTTFKNHGEITGDLYVQNGANAVNEKEGRIDGNVIVEPATSGSYGEAGSEYFVNNGEIEGSLTVTNDAKVFNSGHIDADVTVQSGGEIVLDGGGYIEGDVTLYPGSELRTNDNSQPAEVKGTIYVEYKDEEDRQRLEDILRDSNIYATGGIEWKKHEPDGKLITKEATCYEEGYSYVDCKCGEKGNYTVIPATGKHNLVLSSSTPATCTEPAKEVHRCNTPGCTYQEVTETGQATGHRPVLDEANSVAPTTISEGVVALKCEKGCGWTETASVPMLSIGQEAHTMVHDASQSRSPGCDHTGLYVLKCEGCGQTVSVEIPTTPHSYGAASVRDTATEVEATCTTEGHYDTYHVCQICGAQEESSKETITIPALGHKWIVNKETDENGWIVDEESRSFCTDETTQTRECSVCGEEETEIARGKAHHWEEEGGVSYCTICGMTQDGLNIDYHLNGGIAPQSLMDANKLSHAPGTTVTLWQPTREADDENTGIKGETWTKSTALGRAVFVGWSTVDYGSEPFYNDAPDDLNENIVTEVKFADNATADELVYAVWALDRNGNNKADYEEGKVTLHYDPNGATEGTAPDDLTELLIGGSYPLTTVSNLKKGNDVFAGWSLTATSVVIPEEITGIDSSETDSDGNPVSKVKWSGGSVELLTSPYKIPDDASGTVTLHAVYAVANAEDEPAFDDGYYHVEYYAPGATANRDYTVDPVTGLFYTCNDHHEPGKDAALMTTLAASVMIYKPGAALIGWTDNSDWSTANHPPVTSAAEETLTLIAENNVTIPAKSNAKVYAVWAIDENNNGIRDYAEATLTHTYNLNDRLSSHGSGSSDVATLPLKDANGNQISEGRLRISEENKAKLPNRQDNILPGQYIPFPGSNNDSANIKFADSNVIKEADLYSADGKTRLHHYVQVGWSEYSHRVARSTLDEANWVIGYDLKDDPDNPGRKKDANGYLDENGYYYLSVSDERFINAFVVWAIDDNRNGIPDYRDAATVDPSGSSDRYTPPEGLNSDDHVAYIAGYPDGTVKPAADITRAEVVTILFRLLKDNVRNRYWATENAFSDVVGDEWFNAAVSTVTQMTLVQGYPDGTFRPNAQMTRAELAAVIARLCDPAVGKKGMNFDDVDKGAWYYEYVRVVSALGIMTGVSDTEFRPEAPVKRSEAMATFNRLLGHRPTADGLIEEGQYLNKWPDNADKNAWYYADVQEATNSHTCTTFVRNGVTQERWTAVLPEPDWTAREKAWKDANRAN